jgi:hypothetical protein
LSAGVGVTLFSEDSLDVETLCDMADGCICQMKKSHHQGKIGSRNFRLGPGLAITAGKVDERDRHAHR